MTRQVFILLVSCGLILSAAFPSFAKWDDDDWSKDLWSESSHRRPGFILEGSLPVPRAMLDQKYQGDYGYGVSLVLGRLDFEHWRPVKDRIRLRYTEDWMTLRDSVAAPHGLSDSDKRARLWGLTVGSGSGGRLFGGDWYAVSTHSGTFFGLYGLDVTPKAFEKLGQSTASPLNEEDNQGQFGLSHELALRFTTRHVGVQAGYEFVEVKRALVFWPAVIHGAVQGILSEALPEFLEKYAGHGWAVQLCSFVWRFGITAAAHHLQSYRTDWPYDREHPLLLQRWRTGLVFYL
ncbi:MAG: hypothetical protein FJY66_01955 [Calditrichaeota bacterium]|nr:hypothetical protein [Calditrichota bacterium]